MIDWSNARNLVASTFFHDTVSLCPLVPVEDDVGEVCHEPGQPLGDFLSNLEYQPVSSSYKEAGMTFPQYARVSLSKDIQLDRNTKYLLRIVQARVTFDPEEIWEVVDWVEGQISTVLTIKRRESI